MYPSQIELDRNITTLRINSSELATISNVEMVNLLNQTIENIKTLTQFSSSMDAFDYFDSLKDEEIPPILPKFIKKDGNWIGFLPGDEGYDDV